MVNLTGQVPKSPAPGGDAGNPAHARQKKKKEEEKDVTVQNKEHQEEPAQKPHARCPQGHRPSNRIEGLPLSEERTKEKGSPRPTDKVLPNTFRSMATKSGTRPWKRKESGQHAGFPRRKGRKGRETPLRHPRKEPRTLIARNPHRPITAPR